MNGVRNRLCKGCASTCNGKVHKPTSRKSIAPRSPKRTKQENKYNKRAKEWKEEHPNCTVNIPGRCQHVTHDVHHMMGKENDLLLDERYWKAICRNCHTYITEHSAEAIEMGYSLSRNNNNNNNHK